LSVAGGVWKGAGTGGREGGREGCSIICTICVYLNLLQATYVIGGRKEEGKKVIRIQELKKTKQKLLWPVA